MARNVFAQFAQPVKSVQEYDAEREARELNRLGLEEKRRTNAIAAAAFADQTADKASMQRFAQESGGDQNKLVQLLRNSGRVGLMTQADALEKSMLGRRETESKIAGQDATTGKTQFETQESKRKAAIQQIAALNSPDEAIGLLNQQVSAGAIPMQVAQALERMVRSDPKWQVRLVLGINDPKEMLAALQPHMQNAGGALVNTNPLAGPTGQGAPNAIPITQSADNAAAQATSRANNAATVAATIRGQNLTDERQRQAFEYGKQKDAADRANGVNITEGERNAGGYAQRMTEATKLLDQFESTGRPTYATQAAGAVPFVGDSLRSASMNADQQRYRQAQEDWVRAKLRKESGAAIGVDEMDREISTYFPMPGDLPETVAQKRQARAVANSAMVKAAGRGAQQQPSQAAQSAPIKPGSVIKFDANGNRVQ